MAPSRQKYAKFSPSPTPAPKTLLKCSDSPFHTTLLIQGVTTPTPSLGQLCPLEHWLAIAASVSCVCG